jgi:hypothetical protein
MILKESLQEMLNIMQMENVRTARAALGTDIK